MESSATKSLPLSWKNQTDPVDHNPKWRRHQRIFEGKKISFGTDREDKPIAWQTGNTDRLGVGPAPGHWELVGNPDSGLYAAMIPPYEHRTPETSIFKGTELARRDDQFIFDIRGNRLLRGRAKLVGVDVTPTGTFVEDATDFKELLPSIPFANYDALWLGEDILGKSFTWYSLMSGKTGKRIGTLPQLQNKWVTTVDDIIVAYSDETCVLAAYRIAKRDSAD